MILSCLAVLVIIPVYVFYWKGPQIRLKSKFAQELEIARQKRMARRRSSAATGKLGGGGGRSFSEKEKGRGRESSDGERQIETV